MNSRVREARGVGVVFNTRVLQRRDDVHQWRRQVHNQYAAWLDSDACVTNEPLSYTGLRTRL
jgi:hypothetical protein